MLCLYVMGMSWQLSVQFKKAGVYNDKNRNPIWKKQLVVGKETVALVDLTLAIIWNESGGLKS